MVFVKHKDVLTSVYWRIVLNFDLFTFRELLRNVILTLPKGLGLIVALRPNNVYLYYEVVETIMLADVHCFKLVLNVPPKTVNRQYELYKTVVLPTRISDNAYAQFEVVMIILVLICCNEPT